MKAKITFFEVDEEKVRQAENMGTQPPEPTFFDSELFFDLDSVKVSYINREGDIALHTTVGTWVIPFDKEVWEKLKSHLSDRRCNCI